MEQVGTLTCGMVSIGYYRKNMEKEKEFCFLKKNARLNFEISEYY